MTLLKVEGRNDIVKDSYSGAVLTVDHKADDEYWRQKKLINNTKRTQEEITEIKEKLQDVEQVKQELQEIKALLKELVTK